MMQRVGSLLRRAVARPWLLSLLWYPLYRLNLEGRPEYHLWYFANGANMNGAACRLESGAGRLRGYRLASISKGDRSERPPGWSGDAHCLLFMEISVRAVVGDDPTPAAMCGQSSPAGSG
jgi:hypothetical protein